MIDRRLLAALGAAMVLCGPLYPAHGDEPDSSSDVVALGANGAVNLAADSSVAAIPEPAAATPADPGIDTAADLTTPLVGEPPAAEPFVSESDRRPLVAPQEKVDRATAGDEAPPNRLSLRSLADNEMVRVGSALALVVVLILVLRVILRRFAGPMAGGSRPSGVVEILTRYPVGKGQSIVMFRIARRVLVVHQTSTAMTTLAEIADEDEVADIFSRLEAGSRLQDAARFRRALETCREEHDRAEGHPWSGATPASSDEPVVIDLTRSPRSRRKASAARRSAV